MDNVKLIWITPEAENTIAYCARVSNPQNQTNHSTAPKLLRYCIKHRHWSVFEMASMCMEINTTRSISAQIIRHRSFSIQEFSQRYAAVTERAQVPEIRLQDTKNRQNSIEVEGDNEIVIAAQEEMDKLFTRAVKLYEDLLDAGVAKEVAREVLPLATPTRLYMNGTIRSWVHYIDLRSGNGTQKEHRMIAEQAKAIFCEQLPSVAEALEWL